MNDPFSPYDQVSRLGPEQEPLKNQLINSTMKRGAGGAFGQSADYWRNLISDNSADFNSFTRPEMRRYQEQTIPDLAEQFAGMGSGGMSSSGFRNAAVGAGTDLSERLGAIRAQLRQSAAQSLFGLGQAGLQGFYENTYQQDAPNPLATIAPIAGTVVGGMFGGPPGAMAGAALGQGAVSMMGSSSPYGGGGGQPQGQGRYNLPTFMNR